MKKLNYTNLWTIVYNDNELIYEGYNNNVICTPNNSIIEQFDTEEEMNTRLTELNL